jgi:transposase InsO family protein
MTRFTLLLHLPRMSDHGHEARVKNGPALAGHGAEAVCDAITRTMITLPEQLRRSLTWDQGAEAQQSRGKFAPSSATTRAQASGQHPFDRACAHHAITHRLIRPFRPQTNGMVERFNRRLGEHLDRMPQNRTAHHRRFLEGDLRCGGGVGGERLLRASPWSQQEAVRSVSSGPRRRRAHATSAG